MGCLELTNIYGLLRYFTKIYFFLQIVFLILFLICLYPSKELSLNHNRGGDKSNKGKYNISRERPASGC